MTWWSLVGPRHTAYGAPLLNLIIISGLENTFLEFTIHCCIVSWGQSAVTRWFDVLLGHDLKMHNKVIWSCKQSSRLWSRTDTYWSTVPADWVIVKGMFINSLYTDDFCMKVTYNVLKRYIHFDNALFSHSLRGNVPESRSRRRKKTPVAINHNPLKANNKNHLSP